MADLREKLDKLRAATADLALMSRRTSDSQKRALFQRLADELAMEALELEQVVKLQSRRASHSDLDKVVSRSSLIQSASFVGRRLNSRPLVHSWRAFMLQLLMVRPICNPNSSGSQAGG